MLFTDLVFLLFLPIVFAIYWCLGTKLRWQNLFLVIASYVFYGWWDWRFLLLIGFTSLCSFFSGKLISKANSIKRKRFWLWSNVLINLSILFVYKYFDFFTQSFSSLLASIGLHADAITLDLILPVGISFYTFQALSYSIDIYRGKIPPENNPIVFFAFLSFFPQLVAGPIERATNLLPQFNRARKFDYLRAVSGLRLMLWGFFKKIVIADNLAPFVEAVFSTYDTQGSLTLFATIIQFSVQIYCDFSGYSDIAIGTGRLFGIELMRNFNLPYFSRNLSEFWRRWHISLTTWFIDYIYIPLGGSRKGKSKLIRNTLLVFLISGIWHGAEWTFLFWGLYHGTILASSNLLGKRKRFAEIPGEGRTLPSFYESLIMARTFLIVTIGWILFRADNLPHAIGYISQMFTQWSLHTPIQGKYTFIFILILFAAEWFSRKRECPLDFKGDGLMAYRSSRWTVYWLICIIIILFYKVNTFIYFQF